MSTSREDLYAYLEPIKGMVRVTACSMGIELTNLHVIFPPPIEPFFSFARPPQYRISWRAMYKDKLVGASFGSEEFPSLEEVLRVIQAATIAILESYSGKTHDPTKNCPGE